jgi:hypothetical protein
LIEKEKNRLVININSRPDDDNEQLEQLTLQLNEELRELDVDKVDFIRTGDAPIGAKGDVMTWGSLLLTLTASGGILTSVINTVQSWLTRHERRSIKLKIDDDELEVNGISDEGEQRLIDDWINRHKRKK